MRGREYVTNLGTAMIIGDLLGRRNACVGSHCDWNHAQSPVVPNYSGIGSVGQRSSTT